MKLTVLGCSGSVPGPDSAASSYLVTADGFNLILDLGSGALGSLQRHLAVPEIGAIGLSHLHPDHCMDLCGLYVSANYAPGSPIPRIPVYGPPGTADRMALAYDLPLDPGMEEELEFHAWQDVQQIGPFTVRTAPMVHPVPAYAIRVEHGNKVACLHRRHRPERRADRARPRRRRTAVRSRPAGQRSEQPDRPAPDAGRRR